MAIRKLIERLESQDRERNPEIGNETNVISFPGVGGDRTKLAPSRYAKGRIIVVDVTFNRSAIDEVTYSIPTLLWPGRIDVEASDWFRFLARKNRPLSTILEYAKILRDFINFRQSLNVGWSDVDDNTLRRFRELKLKAGVQVRRVNKMLGVVFAHYSWAEKTFRLVDHVQLFDLREYSDRYARHRFAITSSARKNKKGETIRVCSQTVNDYKADYKRRHTPSRSEIERLHDAELLSLHGERNSLAYAWANLTGGRKFEVLQIALNQMPTREQLARVYAGELVWSISVRRKGNRRGKLYPPADLLRRTMDFIRYERNEIVQNCRLLNRKVSNLLFITNLGTPLTSSALGGLSALAFRRAGIKRCSFHRLRAARAHQEVEAALDAVSAGGIDLGPDTLWKEAILMKVADVLDHRSLNSLQFYLNDIINSRIQKSSAAKLHVVEAALAEKRRTMVAIEKRLEEFRAIAEFSRTGTLRDPTASAMQDLGKMCADLTLFIGRFDANITMMEEERNAAA